MKLKLDEISNQPRRTNPKKRTRNEKFLYSKFQITKATQKCMKFSEIGVDLSRDNFSIDRIRSKGRVVETKSFRFNGRRRGKEESVHAQVGCPRVGMSFHLCSTRFYVIIGERGAWTMRSSCAGASLAMATNGSRDETWKYAGGAPCTATVWSWSSRSEWQTGDRFDRRFPFRFPRKKA